MPAFIRLRDGRFVNLDAAIEVDPQPGGELFLIMPAPSIVEKRAPLVTVIDHPDDVDVAMAYYEKRAGELVSSLRSKHPLDSHPGAVRVALTIN